MCLRVLQESKKSRFDSFSCQEQCFDHIPYYLSGLLRAHFLQQPFPKQLYINGPHHLFGTLHFNQGIFAAASLVLPKDCHNNKFCEIVKVILGPTVRWYISGQFQWKKIRIATGFRDVRIWDGVYFNRLDLYVEVRRASLPRQSLFMSSGYNSRQIPLKHQTKNEDFLSFFIFLPLQATYLTFLVTLSKVEICVV